MPPFVNTHTGPDAPFTKVCSFGVAQIWWRESAANKMNTIQQSYVIRLVIISLPDSVYDAVSKLRLLTNATLAVSLLGCPACCRF